MANMNTTLAAQNVLTLDPQTLCYIITILVATGNYARRMLRAPLNFGFLRQQLWEYRLPGYAGCSLLGRCAGGGRPRPRGPVGSFHGKKVICAFGASMTVSLRRRIGMGICVVWHDEDRRCATAHEIARHAEYEVGVAIHLRQEGITHIHRDIGPFFAQCRRPFGHVVPVEIVRNLGAEPAGRGRHGGNHPLGRAFQHLPDEGAADAEANDQEFVVPVMVHQAEQVINVGIPWPIDLHRARGLAAIGVAQVRGYAVELVVEGVHRVERRAFR